LKQEAAIDTCMPSFQLEFSFSLSNLRPRITEVNTLLVHVSWLRIVREKTNDGGQELPLPDLRLPSFASIFSIEQKFPRLEIFTIRIDELSFGAEGETPILGSLQLTKGKANRTELEATLNVDLTKKQEFALKANLALHATQAKAKIKGQVSGNAGGWNFRSPLEGQWSTEISLYLKPLLQKKNVSHSANLSLFSSPNELRATIESLRLPNLWPGRKVQAKNCDLRAKLDQEYGYPFDTRLHCALEAKATSQKALVKAVEVDLDSKIGVSQKGSSLFADFDFSARSNHDLFSGETNGSGRAEFSAKMQFQRLIEPIFLLRLNVSRFERLRSALEGTSYAVPAPFYTLNGPIQLSAELEKPSQDDLSFLVKLSSDLKSESQSFVTKSSARVSVKRPFTPQRLFDVNAELNLSDVQLEAPPLSLESPPQAVLDRRFETSADRIKNLTPKKDNLDWKLKIVSDLPVRIRTNLLATAIPFAVDMRLSENARPAGTIEVRPMPIEVFHRKAQVEQVRLTFRESSATTEVNGLLLYRNPEVLVKILILGNAKEPRVVFESEPPLNQQQIVSLLLFNKSVQELNEEEASSSASMSQALADGAFGLFSLMFLSSTPIESVGYDPVTETYSVRMRVGSKTTVSVASDLQGDRQYAIRRRIGKRWAVRTELQRNEDHGNTALLTLLEWFNRF